MAVAVAIGAAWQAGADVTVHAAADNGQMLRWFEEMVPMKDGVKLYTYGNLPPEGTTCGIIFMRDPYVREVRADVRAYAKRQAGALKRGYAYVYQHVRGTGMSEGDWVPYLNERADGLATLDWIRKLPHYSGEIFLYGGSYLASVHWSYLDTDPADVKGAVLNIQDVNRYNICYHHGHYKGGKLATWNVGKKKNRPPKRDNPALLTDLPLKGYSVRAFGKRVPYLEERWDHPRPEDPWWNTPGAAGGEYRRALLDSTMPVLMVTGFYDRYAEGIFDMWHETPPGRKANCALVVDAFDHGGRRMKGIDASSPIFFPNGSRHDAGVVDSVLDWFDWCRGRKALTRVRPGETLWYALWGNAWHAAPEMKDAPNALALSLTGDRRLVLSGSPVADGGGVVRFAYDPKNPPTFPGAGCLIMGGMRAQPEPGFRDDVVSFVSDPFADRYNVRGRIKVSLVVTSDCDDTSFYVRLSIRKRDGKWYTLRDDIKSISWDTADYAPGAEARIDYALSDHAFAIEEGDQLRADIAGTNGDMFIPHTNFKGPFAEQTVSRVAHNAVRAGKSRIVLPVE